MKIKRNIIGERTGSAFGTIEFVLTDSELEEAHNEYLEMSTTTMKQWVILEDDTGRVIGTCAGTAQDARDMFRKLEQELPFDEHTWTLYERSNVL